MLSTVFEPHCAAVYGPIVFVYVNVFGPSAALTVPSAPAIESVTVTDSSTRFTVALLKSNAVCTLRTLPFTCVARMCASRGPLASGSGAE